MRALFFFFFLFLLTQKDKKKQAAPSTRMLSLLRWRTFVRPVRSSGLATLGGVNCKAQVVLSPLLRLASSYSTAGQSASAAAAMTGVVFKLTKVNGGANTIHAAKETTETELAPKPCLKLTPSGLSLCLLASFIVFFFFLVFFIVFFFLVFFYIDFLICCVPCDSQSS